ncbi:MAG: hypothetical protein ABMB14_16505, partial [Myxococcota bacterium]
LPSALAASRPDALGMLILDAELVLPGALEVVASVCPQTRVVVIADDVDPALLSATHRIPRLVGFLGRALGAARDWELGYLVRRLLVSPAGWDTAAPATHELLPPGAATVTFRPRTSGDRDRVVEAVELAATNLGVHRRTAAAAADAAHELLMNALYDAPVDAAGTPKFAGDRRAAIALDDGEVPVLRLTIDADHVALDVTDPFGRMTRDRLFDRLYRARTAPDGGAMLDTSHGGAGLGLFKLWSTGSILRFDVVPGQTTHVAWVVDRRVALQAQRSQPRSLYFVGVD